MPRRLQADPSRCHPPGSVTVMTHHLLLLLALAPATTWCRAESVAEQRRIVDDSWRAKLLALADKCDSLQLPEQARATRQFAADRDPQRQYLFLPANLAAANKNTAASKLPESELAPPWRARLADLRREYAASLFQIAERERGSEPAATFRLLHEVLYHDPAHVEAKRIVRVSDEGRPRARQPRVPHAQLGWSRGDWWQIESAHFQVVTDAGQAAGVDLAQRLEEFHVVWRQVFFDFWSSGDWLQARWKGNGGVGNEGGTFPSRRHQIVLFRNREAYLRHLTPQEPKIGLTLGYYAKRNRTSYFHAGPEDNWPVWFHEAAHQLFQETGEPVANVGEKWNFWVVEGIATYLESLVRKDGYFVLGGFDADRLQFARSRVMGGDRLLPLVELARLGREDLQSHPDIRRLYTQSAGLTHWLMDGEQGRWRDEFLKRLGTTYRGQDDASTFLNWPGLSEPEVESSLRRFLVVHEDDLRFLGPPARRRNLSLARAEITNDSLRRLADSDQLEWLDLAYTPISEEGLRLLGKQPSLRRLTLVNTRVTDDLGSALAAWPQLEELDLSGTSIGDAALPQLAGLKKLKVLRLAQTSITDEGAQHLSGFVDLEELDLDQTAVTPAVRARLQQQLPKLQE